MLRRLRVNVIFPGALIGDDARPNRDDGDGGHGEGQHLAPPEVQEAGPAPCIGLRSAARRSVCSRSCVGAAMMVRTTPRNPSRISNAVTPITTTASPDPVGPFSRRSVASRSRPIMLPISETSTLTIAVTKGAKSDRERAGSGHGDDDRTGVAVAGTYRSGQKENGEQVALLPVVEEAPTRSERKRGTESDRPVMLVLGRRPSRWQRTPDAYLS